MGRATQPYLSIFIHLVIENTTDVSMRLEQVGLDVGAREELVCLHQVLQCHQASRTAPDDGDLERGHLHQHWQEGRGEEKLVYRWMAIGHLSRQRQYLRQDMCVHGCLWVGRGEGR